MSFSPGSRNRLTERDLPRFPGESLFDKVARAVCRAGCLPRKELYEAWEVARRVRRKHRGGRVVDVACGHALAAHLMLLLDDSSPHAIAIDPDPPPSSARIAEVLVETWPRLADRVTIRTARLAEVTLEPADVVISIHACGSLTDDVLAAAIAARARVAVLPCCHEHVSLPLAGWLGDALALDVRRAHRLEAAGYAVATQTIDPAITPKHRLLIGTPDQYQ